MLYVGMRSSKLKPTALASALIKKLLEMPLSQTVVPGHTCSITGVRVKGICAYHVICKINPNAVGPFYSVFGYYYILCVMPLSQKKYVGVHRAATGTLVGFTDSTHATSVV